MLVIIAIFSILIIGYIIWQKQELTKFGVTAYQIQNSKVTHPIRAVVLSDLHLWCYGTKNDILIEAIKAQKPDIILIPGDLIVSARVEKYPIAEQLMEQLVMIAPIYMSHGNHESRVMSEESLYHEDYRNFMERLQTIGVRFLNNESDCINLHGNLIHITGLEIDLLYYEKAKKHDYPIDEMYANVGENVTQSGQLEILLAHNPAYMDTYLNWGADIILSGHYHGGLVRIPGIGSVVSPQFQLFPKFSFGCHEKNGRYAIISRGLGTHTFHIRVWNRAELVVVDIQNK